MDTQPSPAKPNNPTGVWIENRDFYKYRGGLPVVVESETIGIGNKPAKSYTVLYGCVSCQLSRIKGRATRWMILPP